MRTSSLLMFCQPRWSSALTIFALALSSCGRTGGTYYPVSGKVTVDGKPLKEALVIFWADIEKGNKTVDRPLGEVKDGTYTLSTRGKPGAPAGWYKVLLKTSYPGVSNPLVLPSRYADPKMTPLSVEVVPHPAADAYDLKLASRD